jgi:hypothetical protein
MRARELLAASDSRFLIRSQKLFFCAADGRQFPAEFLQSGESATLKMPEIRAEHSVEINSVPVMHPSMLICLKVRRWMHIAESTRPASRQKATTDAQDITFLLEWLASSGVLVSFWSKEEKPKSSLLSGFKLFVQLHPETKEQVKTVLDPEDYKMLLEE